MTHGDLTAQKIDYGQGWCYIGDYKLEGDGICDCHEEWWRPVLKGVLKTCREKRLEF